MQIPTGSGSDWTTKELLAFNIRVANASAPAFFASTKLPPAPVSPTILNNLHIPDGPLSKSDRQFFQYLRAAEHATSGESAVDDFAAFILRMLDYDDEDRVVRLRKEISFYMAGERVGAKADVCVMNDLDYLLLVKEDKRQQSSDDPEPQLIAEAIAAYYQNNFRRTRAGLPALPPILMPGITMVGTAPIFYRIPISPQLLEALVTSTYPKEETIVLRFIPPVANAETYFFDAFKASMNVMQSKVAPQVQG
ncbi:hypothetical protein NLJ89_g2 [Agrocybe chaxingu]|uniref:Uncharacterized protein n=1 Tax=Agrocybe chaxingu TaxID=84603 RepID=A0A9W8N2T7_9AGAR|nr:hypothetical protein NLJ89_g2 [Agrocybe chaxingu]